MPLKQPTTSALGGYCIATFAGVKKPRKQQQQQQ